MKSTLQHSIRWGCIACGFASLALLVPPSSGEAKKKLPMIQMATHQSYTEKLNDNVSLDMVAIPGGTYLMGSPKTEKGHKPDESPQHPVTVLPFWMGKCEVTWDEYDLYWVKRPGQPEPKTKQDKLAHAVTRPTPPYADPTFGHGRRGNPVLCITHHAAMKYCEWLSAKTGKNYRLPTEAEWEWACRAGTTTAYSFGDDPDKLDDYAWYDDNADEVAHKVGKKKPNPWGLYDMHGNVSEWCLDHYSKDAYSKFPTDKATLMPVFLPTANRYSHVARGGSWFDLAPDCRSAARQHSTKDWLRRDPQRPQSIWWMTDADYVGFRIVRGFDEPAKLQKLKSTVTPQSK